MPIFSGNGVNTFVNKLDTKKLDLALEKKKYDNIKQEIVGIFDTKAFILNNTKQNKKEANKPISFMTKPNSVKLTNFDVKVIEDYIQLKTKLDIRKQTKIFFDVLEWEGLIPEARESAALWTYKDSLYLYGGVGSQKFDYFNIFDFNLMKWNKVDPNNSNINDIPVKRYGHSMNVYSNYFVMFGGCGSYSEKTKLHENFKDLRIFDIKKFEWQKQDYKPCQGHSKNLEPEKRMFHAAGVM